MGRGHDKLRHNNRDDQSNRVGICAGGWQCPEYGVTTTATFGQATAPNNAAFSVTISDITDNTQAVAEGTVEVTDAPLTLFDTNPAPGATEGSPLTNFPLMRFTDGNSSAPLTDYVGTIDWGDGSPTSVATFSPFGAQVSGLRQSYL